MEVKPWVNPPRWNVIRAMRKGQERVLGGWQWVGSLPAEQMYVQVWGSFHGERSL
jgi:hypothetical protein